MAIHNQDYRRSNQDMRGSQAETDFEQWAKAVKQQMIAALKRRGN